MVLARQHYCQRQGLGKSRSKEEEAAREIHSFLGKIKLWLKAFERSLLSEPKKTGGGEKMNRKFKTDSILLLFFIFLLSFSISTAQEYSAGNKKENPSGIDHSVYEKVKRYISDKQKLFDPGRFRSNTAYILGGFRGCNYAAGEAPDRDSLMAECMRRIEAKYVPPRKLITDRLTVDADLSEGEDLLQELQTYYPEAAGKMFRNYLNSLGASIDSVTQVYLYALGAETSGVWRQFADLPSDSMDNAIDDYVQKSAAEIYQLRLFSARSGERIQKLGEELIAFLSNYIRKTGKVY